MEIREVLEKVKEGELSVNEAASYLRREPFEEMGYAKLDMHRRVRSGFSEVIFCSGKTDEHLLRIFGKLYETDGEVFGTRATAAQYEMIQKEYPMAMYDPVSHILKIEKPKKRIGKIAVCTAGNIEESVKRGIDYFMPLICLHEYKKIVLPDSCVVDKNSNPVIRMFFFPFFKSGIYRFFRADIKWQEAHTTSVSDNLICNRFSCRFVRPVVDDYAKSLLSEPFAYCSSKTARAACN